MIFRFLILSDETEDFKREIQIDGDASFLDLHKAIIESVNYKDAEMTSFFICSDSWEKEREITLVEMDTTSEEDSYTMESSILNDFLEDERQKLMYVFDYFSERALFMELREIITGKNLDSAKCTKSIGIAPPQFVDFDEAIISTSTLDTGEVFYGSDSYNIEELDLEGFEDINESSANNSEEF